MTIKNTAGKFSFCKHNCNLDFPTEPKHSSWDDDTSMVQVQKLAV